MAVTIVFADDDKSDYGVVIKKLDGVESLHGLIPQLSGSAI